MELDTRRNLLLEGGVALLDYTVSVPHLDGDDPLRKYFETVTERTVSYLEGVLAEALRREYLASPERHKRFTFRRASYRMVYEMTEGGEFLRTVSLVRAGRRIAFGQTLEGRCGGFVFLAR